MDSNRRGEEPETITLGRKSKDWKLFLINVTWKNGKLFYLWWWCWLLLLFPILENMAL